jgi:hypothetical protein
MSTKLGLQLEQADHTLKFRLHNSGMLHAMLKWRLHKNCEAIASTRLNLSEVPKGSISSLPLGFRFNVEY